MINDPRLWFGPKKYGFGLSPHTWEGWALLAMIILGTGAFAALT